MPHKPSSITWFLLLAVSLGAQLCWADSPPAVSALSLAQDNASTAANKASLGQYAEIQIPQGYRFFDAATARALLDHMNNPVAPGLVGVLAPNDGKWWAALEFNDVGYLKNVGAQQLDPAAILKDVQARNTTENKQQMEQGVPRIQSVDWEMEPKYDANAHSLEWAFRAAGPSGAVINHVIALFGRRGVLEITAVQPDRTSQGHVDLVPLNDFVRNITFKEGQAYADYQSGDKVASAGLKEIVLGGDSSAPVGNLATASIPRAVIWGYSFIGGCVALGSALLVYGKLRKGKRVPPAAHSNGHAVVAVQTNGKVNGNTLTSHRTLRQKKMFNYQKFYSDMVLQLSGHTYAWVNPGSNGNGLSPSAQRAPSQSATAPQPPAAPQSLSNQALVNANLELIACQKNLIEEQKNLMHEQTRIIEEKAKLIKEYNQLMEKWSEDMENQFSLKLD